MNRLQSAIITGMTEQLATACVIKSTGPSKHANGAVQKANFFHAIGN
jgi:hypothetical protein